MIEDSSEKVRDDWIAKSFSRNRPSLAFLVSLRSASDCATNTGGRIKSERIAIADAACVFAADTVGTETIAEGRFGKRLCLPAGRAFGQQYRTAFKWIGTGGESSRVRRRRIESPRL